ncbi:hypothetical protein Tco_1292524 [Tanacetum coccineum]
MDVRCRLGGLTGEGDGMMRIDVVMFVDEPIASTYDVGGSSTAIAAQLSVQYLAESSSMNQVKQIPSQWQTTVAEIIMAPKQMSQAAIAKLVSDEVAKALAADRATRNATGAGGPGNVEGAGNAGGPERAQQARDCTFSSFMKCGPTQFHGKEGAIELCRWFEKMESTFGISECAERSKVKFAAATLQVIMEYLVKISKKARILELKGRYLKITVLTPNTPYPLRKIRRISQRVSDAIEAIAIYEMKIRTTHDLMNHIIRQEIMVEKDANNKRKFENQPKDNRVPQQPPFKKPDVARLYST